MTSQFHFDVIVKDQFGQSNKDYRIDLTDYTIVEDIINKIATDFEYTIDNIELTLHNGYNRYLNLSLSDKEKSLQEVGWKCDTTDNLIINSALANQLGRKAESKKMSIDVQDSSEDNLILGASASPTIGEIPSSEEVMYPKYSMQSNVRPVIVEAPCNYVGLVNQAMTCYLNSLLQALYMTPEFRNALYNWEFDGQNETRSIPYQLQKLFLNLQTSPKSAVETTDLTTSFGWQGSDAWHQHDIQELCRVMFDALEQKFKDTKQANLINDLYEGKMLDYVKCLDCGTEKSREDTFLDIPLPVRPFGSVAYNSVEEALRAFVQPETLEGNNQYKCDKCDKKCDAHKGLKFTKFPYLLTLHLKRFDFDYNAMHRIKLNDKVVFPEILNLNSFVAPNRSETEDDRVKCDDCSTADSGSADDESCQGTDVSSTVNGHDDNCADSDEGIDVSSGINHSENDAKGPYVYELFSIMIHSGSATGGHYYAYIKDFDKNLWFCFNDQSVSGITEDDIRKTYGGGPQRYYSGAYGSSTNAYMLMYRQIDKDRNCRVISGEAFPAHIQKLLHEMRQKEEEDRINREKENDMLKLSVNCYVPNNNMLQVVKIALFNDSTLAEAAELAYDRLKLDGIVALEDCRIVVYNKKQDCIDYNFDSQIIQFCNLTSQSNMRMNLMHIDWMLEIKEPGTEFPSYKRGGINMKVYPINLDTEEVEEPCQVRVDVDETVKELKMDLSLMLNIDVNQIQVVMEMYSNEPKYLSNDDDVISFVANCTDYKLYVASALDDDPTKEFNQSKLQKVIERFGYIISINVFIPETDISTLEMLSIPSLDLNQNLDGGNGTISPSSRVSPQPGSVGLSNDGFGDQSNSEDSSLSDSDRTLIGEAPGEFIGMPSSTLNSPADQHMASPVDPAEDTYNYEVMGNPLEAMNWEESEVQKVSNTNYYFNVISGQLDASGGDSTKYVGSCKILVDKRMTLERFKKHLELIVGVPMDYFKIIKQYPNSDDEWSSLSDTLRSAKDGERLLIKLGRILRKNELNCKVFHLKPNCKDANSFLFEHIIAKNQTVSSVKKEILHQAKKQHLLDIPYAKCRLREKNWKKPRKVYFDDQKFSDDITIISNFEMYLQELKDVDTVSSTSQTVLFLRQWCPATLTLKDVEEIVLDSSTMEDFKIKLSEMHDGEIPVENLDLVCVKAAFPCDIHLLEINGLEWNQSVTHLTQWPMQADDGSMFFYRDNREELMELSETMRKELEQNENTRLGRPSSKSNYYSPGKERALKIYLDTSPSKSEDNCID